MHLEYEAKQETNIQFSNGSSDAKIDQMDKCMQWRTFEARDGGMQEEKMEDGVLLLFTFRVRWRDERAGQDGDGT